MKRRTLLLALSASVWVTPWAAYAQASNWPTQPIKLVVGFGGGSTPDMVARTLAEPLSQALGQPVVVENKPGASGNIAADHVAKATDGHTLGIVINGNLTSSQQLYPDLPYDPLNDFSYISLVTTAPLLLVTSADQPDGADFLAKAVEGGDRWNYGSVGVGSVSHLGMELLKSRVPGLEPMQVPYTGGNPAVVTAIIGKQVEMGMMPPGVAVPQIESGRLKAVGVTSSEPSDLVPGIPSLSDAGVKDFNLEVWNAVVGPASLPPEIQARLSETVVDIVHRPEIREKLFNQGWTAVGTTSEGMRERVEEEARLLGDIIREQDIRLQ